MDDGFSAFSILSAFSVFVLTAAVTWIGTTLVSLKTLAKQQVALLQWLKEEHESDDSKFSTVRILPLIERILRVAKATRALTKWHAEQATGQVPPPDAEGE